MKYFVIILVLLIIYIIYLYNKLINLNMRCKNAYAQIDNQLKRRKDLIPNLVEVTKGYMKYETEALVKIVEKRGNTITDIANNSLEVSKSVKNILALSENYPDLKANELFKNLQIELTGTEDKIAFARQFYNDCVQMFNTSLEAFPSNLVGKLLNYKQKEYFSVSEEEKKVVDIKL